jgi:hypothetical protein
MAFSVFVELINQRLDRRTPGHLGKESAS